MKTIDGAQPATESDGLLNELRAEAGSRPVEHMYADHVHNHTVTLRVGGLLATLAVTGDNAPVHEVLRGGFEVEYIGGKTFSFEKCGRTPLSFRARVAAIDRWDEHGANADEQPLIAHEQASAVEVVGE